MSLLDSFQAADKHRAAARAKLVSEVQRLAAAGYSLYSLAKATGYSQPTIKQWVAGQK